MDFGGSMFVFVIFVEPLVRLKMLKTNPILTALQSWVEADSCSYAVFVVALKAKPCRLLTLVGLEVVAQALL
jgi:hypothetical protein